MTLLRADVVPNDRQAEDRQTGNMIWIPGGTFRMGSDQHYPEEAPAHRVTVNGFWIDRTPVTNRQFKQFVEGDRLRHLCRNRARPERLSWRAAAHALCRLARLHPPPSQVDLRDWSQWWTFMKGADWRHPYGPKSNINGLDDHPVVHVAYRRRAGLCQMGRQGSADRGRMGIRRARRA